MNQAVLEQKKQSVEEIANNTNQINYEVISTISERVPRIFIK